LVLPIWVVEFEDFFEAAAVADEAADAADAAATD
jgi:hypothetical protein